MSVRAGLKGFDEPDIGVTDIDTDMSGLTEF
jgi:hypothetical protein